MVRVFAPLSAVLSSVALCCAPIVRADPFDGASTPGSAQSVIDDLTAQGCNVAVNWVSGVSSRPLDECAVLGVHNPDSSGGPPTTFTTVYVDVSCPNHDDRVAGAGGVGITFG